MAIIPGHFCEDCADKGREDVPAEHELDSWGVDSGGGGFLCDNCASHRYDAWQEAKFEAYHGGSSPCTIQEQSDHASRVKREQR